MKNAIALLAAVPAACSFGYSSPMPAAETDAGALQECQDDPSTCLDECGPSVDVSVLVACADDAHCVPGSLIPTEEQDRFAACEDGISLCVPDVFVVSGGMFILTACVSVNGIEGRCMSTTLPDI